MDDADDYNSISFSPSKIVTSEKYFENAFIFLQFEEAIRFGPT